MADIGIQLRPGAIDDDSDLVIALSLGAVALSRARRFGHLRLARMGRRTLYVGQWVLDWIWRSAIECRSATQLDRRPEQAGLEVDER